MVDTIDDAGEERARRESDDAQQRERASKRQRVAFLQDVGALEQDALFIV